MFNLPCKCSVSNHEVYFIPRLGSCHKHIDYGIVLHPVNLVLVQHFFDATFAKQIFPDTTFKTSVNISVQTMKFYEHQMSNVIADDTKAH